MKLLSITLKDAFNSLQPFETKRFDPIINKDGKVDPICLIGINGSGKSNLLELIAETFFCLEINHRFERDKTQKTRAKKGVEIIYILERKKDNRIKILTKKGGLAKLYIETDQDYWEEILDSDLILDYLPSKIVGYTSGMNETLSFRFNQLDEAYSENVRINAKAKSKEVLPDNRMVFLDYESNEAIVISNYLIRDKSDLSIFNTLLRINGLHSFRIIINLKRKGKSGSGKNDFVSLSKELEDNIKKLKKCSVCYFHDSDNQYYEFDFLVNEATHAAFETNFESVYNLFMVFQKFELLNSLNLEKKYRKTSSKDDLADFKPVLAKEDKVFRFEEILLNITNPDNTIPYIGISDGEHQFLQILGAIMIFDQSDVLFLLDEPETHFNPTWRIKFIFILNENIKGRNQEIVITTHSPYIVSDCKGYRVFKFRRIDGKVSFEEIGIETFGTSFDIILKKAFDINETISTEASSEIKILLNSDNKDEIQTFVEQTGPSFEKMALLKHLKDLSIQD